MALHCGSDQQGGYSKRLHFDCCSDAAVLPPQAKQCQRLPQIDLFRINHVELHKLDLLEWTFTSAVWAVDLMVIGGMSCFSSFRGEKKNARHQICCLEHDREKKYLRAGE